MSAIKNKRNTNSIPYGNWKTNRACELIEDRLYTYEIKANEYEYKHKMSKTIIDEIDKIIGKSYDLNKEEIDYIINFAYKYRMNDLAEEVESWK